MNRRSFFGLLPAATLVPVAAHGAATVDEEKGVFLPESATFVGPNTFSGMMSKARKSGRRVTYHRYMNESLGPADNWVRRDGIVDMLSVDGRVVAMRVSPKDAA